jgi:adenosine kinase
MSSASAASSQGDNTAARRGTVFRLGDVVPDFKADTSDGMMESYHKYLGGDSWGVLFSHPDDFTPVCTTELLRVTQLANEFAKRKCKLAAVSCNDVSSHKKWIKDICAFGNMKKKKKKSGDSGKSGKSGKSGEEEEEEEEDDDDSIPFPIIADPKRELAYSLGMIDPVVKDSTSGMPMTCRAVFIIGLDKTLKLSILYPASTGRNFDEILRVIDSLQMTANYKCATPADWNEGNECMVLPSLSDADAKKAFPSGFRQEIVPSGKPYLRFTRDPREYNHLPLGIIVGFENPLLDMCCHVPIEFLDKYGLKLNNAILAESEHIGIYEEMKKLYKVDYVAGGAAQNTIRVAQWMLQSPGSTKYIGSIGKDCEFGKKLRQVANADGVTTLYYESDKYPTGTCAVLVNGGERSLVANLAAANDYKHSHTLTKEVKVTINNAEYYYTTGFFLTPPEGLKTMLYIAEHASNNNKVYGFNIAAPFLVEYYYDQMSQILPYTDFIFANESEAATFAKKHGWDEKDIGGIAMKVAGMEKKNKKRERVVVFTQGKHPTVVYHNGKVEMIEVPLLDKSKIVDTNGAGDAFVGGFLSQLIRGKSIEECVRAGNYASREVIQRSGCTFPPFPSFQ